MATLPRFYVKIQITFSRSKILGILKQIFSLSPVKLRKIKMNLPEFARRLKDVALFGLVLF